MPSSRGGPKKHDGKLAEKFREACPPHKVKDLDALITLCKGDESKIQAKITEWWEEPQIEEPQWESVGKTNKKAAADKKERGGGTSARDRGGDRGGDRSGAGFRNDRDRSGRRGERPSGPPRREGKGGGRAGSSGRPAADRDRNRGGGASQQKSSAPPLAPKPTNSGVPTPVTSVPGPKGVWGGGQSFAAAAASTSSSPPTPAAPVPKQPEETQPPTLEPEDEVPVDLGAGVGMISSLEDPTPSGLPSPSLAPPAPAGNVWGTRGGAHLIQAERKPIPPPAPPQLPVVVAPEVAVEPGPEVVPEERLPSEQPETPEQTFTKENNSFGVSLDGVLPPSVNGANINASGWEPILDHTAESSQQQQQQPSTISPMQPGEPEPVLSPKQPPSAVAVAPAAGVKPSSVLNMGHWETGDGDDDGLDFGFGSFAPDNDTAELTETTGSGSTGNGASTSAPAPTATASPARPPPGLSMPPMPANAMLVHELENKLENTTLNGPMDGKTATASTSQTSASQPQSFHAVNELTGQMNPPGMSQYSGMGMYNIPGGAQPMPNGLGNNMPGQFPLDGSNSQQQQQQSNPQQNDSSRPGNSGVSNNSAGGSSNDANAPGGAPSSGGINAGMPPGMPSMQYHSNPAYLYPGQFNQMGHPAYGAAAAMQAAYGGYQQPGPPFAPPGPQGGHPNPNPPAWMNGGYYDEAGRDRRDDRGQGRRGNRYGNSNSDGRSHGGYRDNFHGNPNMGGYGGGPGYYQGNPNVGGYHQNSQGGGYQGNNYQGSNYGGGGGGGGSGFSHQKQGGGGFQQQSHLHQQPLGGASNSDNATGGVGSSTGGGGGWPGSRQQNWSGNWQQEN